MVRSRALSTVADEILEFLMCLIAQTGLGRCYRLVIILKCYTSNTLTNIL